jgi:hypothetical protein
LIFYLSIQKITTYFNYHSDQFCFWTNGILRFKQYPKYKRHKLWNFQVILNGSGNWIRCSLRWICFSLYNLPPNQIILSLNETSEEGKLKFKIKTFILNLIIQIVNARFIERLELYHFTIFSSKTSMRRMTLRKITW